jgi:hypothetical protein
VSEALDNDLLKEAMARIGRTPDGRVLYLFLQKMMMGIPASGKAGALRENLGRRILASEIRSLMSEAVKTTDPGIDERPVVFASLNPVANPGHRGARRRVADPGSVVDTGSRPGSRSGG